MVLGEPGWGDVHGQVKKEHRDCYAAWGSLMGFADGAQEEPVPEKGCGYGCCWLCCAQRPYHPHTAHRTSRQLTLCCTPPFKPAAAQEGVPPRFFFCCSLCFVPWLMARSPLIKHGPRAWSNC